MKKILLGLMSLLLLAGCSMLQGTPVNDDIDLSTRVAQILTDNPTSEVSAPFPVQTIAPEESMPSTTPTETLVVIEAPTEELATKTSLPTLTPLPSETPTITATIPPTAAPPETDPRLSLGDATSTDLFTTGNQWVWPIAGDDYASNEIRDGYMVMRSEGTSSGWRLPAVQGGSDLYIEGTFRTDTCSGKDTYGIMFRVPIRSEADRGYFFGVSCDGQYKVMWDGKVSKATVLIAWTSTDAILTGSNQTNRLGVLTKGDDMQFYINGYLMDSTRSSTFPGGYFGVYIDPTDTEHFTYYLEEMSYWIQ